jgi:hypothetical protein
MIHRLFQIGVSARDFVDPAWDNRSAAPINGRDIAAGATELRYRR